MRVIVDVWNGSANPATVLHAMNTNTITITGQIPWESLIRFSLWHVPHTEMAATVRTVVHDALYDRSMMMGAPRR